MRFMCNKKFLTPKPPESSQRGLASDGFHTVGYFFIFIFISMLYFSCTKDKKKEYDPTPVLEFVSVSPITAIQNQDTITFTIKYADGDGDLGENNPDAKNLFLIDNRINISEVYRISQLAPSGSAIPIKGTLDVKMKNVALTDSSNQQTATFSIYVVDRAGHQSNAVTSPVITIKK